MQDYSFDLGIVEYPMNGTVLRMNPSDQNLYFRFMSIQKDLEEMEAEYESKTAGFAGKLDTKGFPVTDDGSIDIDGLTDEQKEVVVQKTEATLDIMRDIDNRVKRKLEDIFGLDNDFNKIFNGLNVMSFGRNGSRVLSNFISIVTPLIKEAASNGDSEVDKLVGNREQRRARNRPV